MNKWIFKIGEALFVGGVMFALARIAKKVYILDWNVDNLNTITEMNIDELETLSEKVDHFNDNIDGSKEKDTDRPYDHIWGMYYDQFED